MKVNVLTRTEGEGRRIVEDVFLDLADASNARQDMLKQYSGRQDLCSDAEIDKFDVDVYVATFTKSSVDSDPTTTILRVGTRLQCEASAEQRVSELNDFINGTLVADEGTEGRTWRGVDDDTHVVYVIEVQKA